MSEQRSHTPKGARAREKIVRVAERLLGVSGFHGTSMRDVAVAAGLPLASVVYHFAKKEQLYAAVLADIGGELEDDLAGALAEDGRTWAARLDALVRALVAWTERSPGRVKLLVRELLDNPARVAKASKLPLRAVLVRMSTFVEAGVRAGAFLPVAPETAVLHLVGAMSYVVAARPTVKRIVGAERARQLHATYEREALTFAQRLFHGSEATSQPGQTRSRARRSTHDGRGRRARPDAPAGRDVSG